MKKWNLEQLYTGFDSKAFKEDLNAFETLIQTINHQSGDFDNYNNKAEKLINHLNNEMTLNALADKLIHFASLNTAVDSAHQVANKMVNQLMVKLTDLTKTNTLFTKWMRDYPDLQSDIEANELLKTHAFHLKEIQDEASHMLCSEMEVTLAKLRQTGSSAWGKLQSRLTSMLDVEYNGQTITLSEVRNLATDKDPNVRKMAYEAELKAYEKIEDSVCASLNSIKGEVNTIAELRGYKSPLDQALNHSRMDIKTLEAMQAAVKEYYGIFRQYLKRKGQLLGHKNGLPFYDLFAPMGKNDTTFTIEQANAYVLKNFGTFSPRLKGLAQRAFDEEWVDYTPRKGKRGGAFCANIHAIKQSRVMTNFTGSFSDMITLSHELGHAYHGEAIFKETNLNSNYTMPVAETASTFCETIVNNAAIKDVKSKEEKIFLLESSIQDYTQVVIDIMSRFIFEKSVFDGRRETVFDAKELKELMIDAQKKTYGDGLDQDVLHPYMWVCKPHYYSGGLSYYNFPYTYGLLFAKGLYAKYLEDKEAFVNVYDDLLAATGQMSVEDVAKLANIDVTQKAFWASSLELLKKDIELFLELTE